MIGRYARKLAALILMLIGAILVSGVVSTTPVVGPPQFDYPFHDNEFPFWSELTLDWIAAGGGGVLLVALGMCAWDDKGAGRPGLMRALLVGALWFALIAAFRMGLGSAPRWALVNGVVSSALITLFWAIASFGLVRARGDRLQRAVVALVGSAVVFATAMAGVALVTGMPLGRLASFWWPLVAIISLAAALLMSLTVRKNGQAD